ncbi:hypothetical protein RND81_06G221100 [Saponaria officinalis]|uniref:Reverse transcriptase zinc-binding domain-containing protein n=1 Tax=Saponaria officinalis TaxID=3572 RepID=A0AAW1K9X5_SAPOF
MSVFKLPANFCQELRSLVSRFWWGAENGRRKISWIAWRKLCEPKGRGGLGFRDYRHFNSALLGKQTWRLTTNEDCLMSRILKGKYFPDGSFLEAEVGSNPSYTWRSIWGACEVLNLGIRKRIENGLSTRIWSDPWVPGTQSRRIISPNNGVPETLVSELLDDVEGGWNVAKVRSLFLPFEQERVLNIRISESRPNDIWCWDPERNGIYSVRSAYRVLRDENSGGIEASDNSEDKWLWNQVWAMPVLPRIKVFFWQLCNESIPTKKNLASRLSTMDTLCPMCHTQEESCIHLLRGCGWAGRVWEGLGVDVLEEIGFEGVREWVEVVMREMGQRERACFVVGCWAIWERRNKVVFDNGRVRADEVITRVEDILREMRAEGEDVAREKEREEVVK